MHVEVKLFAGLRENHRRRFSLEMAAGARVRDVLQQLQIDEADVGILIVNHRDATFDRPLRDGDRLTLIPPMGGG